MTDLLNVFSSSVMERLGWTLLHTLWEFTLIAVCLGVVLALIPRRAANVRYLTACVALLAMLIVGATTYGLLPTPAPSPEIEVIATLSVEEPIEVEHDLVKPEPMIDSYPTFNPEAYPPMPPLGPFPEVETSTPIPTPPVVVAEREPVVSESSQAEAEEDSVAPWISSLSIIWILGVFVLSVRNIGGGCVAFGLRRRGTEPLPELIAERIAVLAKKMGFRRSILARLSHRVDVPSVVGALRPVILLPVSLATGVPAAQLDAMLAHELAHIRRYDFLINMLQRAAETLLFYQPVVWWTSRCIRREREHACDDLAVRVCGDSAPLAEALAAMAASRLPTQAAMGASGPRCGSTLERVQRLLNVKSESIGPAKIAASFLSLALLATAVVVGAGLFSGETTMAETDVLVEAEEEESDESETAPSEDQPRIGIYLSLPRKGWDSESFNPEKMDPAELEEFEEELNSYEPEFEKTPVLTEEDIVEYDWDSHRIELRPGVYERLQKDATAPPFRLGIGFAVVVDGVQLYTGSFSWRSNSRIMYPMKGRTSIQLWLPDGEWPEDSSEVPNEDSIQIELQPHRDEISVGSVVGSYESSDDPRPDPRFHAVLQELGLLRESAASIDGQDPELAALRIIVDIPGAVQGNESVLYRPGGGAPSVEEAGEDSHFTLQLRTWDIPDYNGNQDDGRQFAVGNPGEILLKNIQPGPYDFRREKMYNFDRSGRSSFLDRQNLELEPGEVTTVRLVRDRGQQVKGRVVGFPDTVAGVTLSVRPVEASGDPRSPGDEWKLPTFDSLICAVRPNIVHPPVGPGLPPLVEYVGQGSREFTTSVLEPGEYRIVAHGWEPEPEEYRMMTGFRLPEYFGTVIVTVEDDDPKDPSKPIPEVVVELGPRADWGEAVDGVRVKATSNRVVWNLGDRNKILSVSVEVIDPEAIENSILASRNIEGNPEREFVVEVDGVQYIYGYEYHPRSYNLDAPDYPSDLELPLGGFVRREHTSSNPEDNRLQLTPGKHTIRVLFIGMVQDPPPASLEFEIEILPEEEPEGSENVGELSSIEVQDPELAALRVVFDIPGAVQSNETIPDNIHAQNGLASFFTEGEAQFVLALPYAADPEVVRAMRSKVEPKYSNGVVHAFSVGNPGEFIVQNVVPGQYELKRKKVCLPLGIMPWGLSFDSQNIELEPGELKTVRVVRSRGQQVEGRIEGVPDRIPGVRIIVFPKEATDDLRSFHFIGLEATPYCDAFECESGGRFTTSLLAPGEYRIVAYAKERSMSSLGDFGSLPEHVGTAIVTVEDDDPKNPTKRTPEVVIDLTRAEWGEPVDGIRIRANSKPGRQEPGGGLPISKPPEVIVWTPYDGPPAIDIEVEVSDPQAFGAELREEINAHGFRDSYTLEVDGVQYPGSGMDVMFRDYGPSKEPPSIPAITDPAGEGGVFSADLDIPFRPRSLLGRAFRVEYRLDNWDLPIYWGIGERAMPWQEPGRHTIRILYTGLEQDPPPASQPFEIEIVDPGWNDGLQIDAEPRQVVWNPEDGTPTIDVELKIENQEAFERIDLLQNPQMIFSPEPFMLLVDGVSYGSVISDEVLVFPLLQPFEWKIELDDRWTTSEWSSGRTQYFVLSPGKHKVRVLFMGLKQDPIPMSREFEIEIVDPNWGEPVDGIQVRARPKEIVYSSQGGAPRIAVDVQVTDRYAFNKAEIENDHDPTYALDLNGVRYEWSSSRERPPRSDGCYQDELVYKNRSGYWIQSDPSIEGSERRVLTPGKYTTRLLFLGMGQDPPPASQPFEFKVLSAREIDIPSPLGPPVIAICPATGHKHATQAGRHDEAPFELQFTAGDLFDTTRPEKYPLDGFVLRNPLLTEKEIISYDWETHTIQLTSRGLSDLRRWRSGGRDTPFVIVVEGKPAYFGAFTSGASPTPNMPTIRFDHWDEELSEDEPSYQHNDAIRIEGRYISTEGEDANDYVDPRDVPGLKAALQRLGKLTGVEFSENPLALQQRAIKPLIDEMAGETFQETAAHLNYASGYSVLKSPVLNEQRLLDHTLTNRRLNRLFEAISYVPMEDRPRICRETFDLMLAAHKQSRGVACQTTDGSEIEPLKGVCSALILTAYFAGPELLLEQLNATDQVANELWDDWLANPLSSEVSHYLHGRHFEPDSQFLIAVLALALVQDRPWSEAISIETRQSVRQLLSGVPQTSYRPVQWNELVSGWTIGGPAPIDDSLITVARLGLCRTLYVEESERLEMIAFMRNVISGEEEPTVPRIPISPNSMLPQEGESTAISSSTPRIALYPVLGHENATPLGRGSDDPPRRIIFSDDDRFDAKRPEKYAYDGLILDEMPLLTDEEIVSYDWETHTIHLKSGELERLQRWLKPSVWGVPFAIVVEGETVYMGCFWTGASSRSSVMPTICLDAWMWGLTEDEPSHLPHDAIRISNRYLAREGVDGGPNVDLRNAPALRAAIEDLGKLSESVAESEDDVPWGEPHADIKIRLRPSPDSTLEEPVLLLDVWNVGEEAKTLNWPYLQSSWIDVDGRWYSRVKIIDGDVPAVQEFTLEPGQKHFALDTLRFTSEEQRQWLGGYVRTDGLVPSPTTHESRPPARLLNVTLGEGHQVRLALPVVHPHEPMKAEYAYSNEEEVEIEETIAPDLIEGSIN